MWHDYCEGEIRREQFRGARTAGRPSGMAVPEMERGHRYQPNELRNSEGVRK